MFMVLPDEFRVGHILWWSCGSRGGDGAGQEEGRHVMHFTAMPVGTDSCSREINGKGTKTKFLKRDPPLNWV